VSEGGTSKVRFVPHSRRSLSDLTMILFANAANGSNEPILWKKNVLQAQKVGP